MQITAKMVSFFFYCSGNTSLVAPEALAHCLQRRTACNISPELEIVVELGNLVPRKNFVSQKVFMILRYLQSWTAKMFLKLLHKLFVLLRLYQFLLHTHDCILIYSNNFVSLNISPSSETFHRTITCFWPNISSLFAEIFQWKH